MSSPAARLNVQDSSIYYHIHGKTEFIKEVLSISFNSCIEIFPSCGTRQEWMCAFAFSLWDVQNKLRFLPLLILTTELNEAHISGIYSRLESELERFNLDPIQAAHIHSLVQAVTTGWAIFAHSRSSSEYARHYDLRTSALRSVDSVIKDWESTINEDGASLGPAKHWPN